MNIILMVGTISILLSGLLVFIIHNSGDYNNKWWQNILVISAIVSIFVTIICVMLSIIFGLISFK